jgi:hypothetical protein
MHKRTSLPPQPAASERQTQKPTRRLRSSNRISLRQATNLIEAVKFAKLIDLPLVAHLTIHWSLTDIGDDPDGKLFSKVREGLDKWLHRHGVEFAGAWARERQSGGQSNVVHCHLLFHLPVEYRMGKKLRKLEATILRLVKRHGGEVTDDRAIKLTIHENPDGKYLIKGGGPEVWTRFRLRREHRRPQGFIHGKRCGTTENIGPAARKRRNDAFKIGESYFRRPDYFRPTFANPLRRRRVLPPDSRAPRKTQTARISASSHTCEPLKQRRPHREALAWRFQLTQSKWKTKVSA